MRGGLIEVVLNICFFDRGFELDYVSSFVWVLLLDLF